MMIYWKIVDWSWILIVGICCSFIGGLSSYERAAQREVPVIAQQSFLIQLKPDLTPQERMELRARMMMTPGVHNVRWLSQREVLNRILREDISETEVEILAAQIPQVIELSVPTALMINRHFDPTIFRTYAGVDRYYWDENFLAMTQEEQVRWRLHSQQIQMGMLMVAILVILAAFVLTNQRNRLRFACEQAGVIGELDSRVGLSSEVYLAQPAVWLKIMGVEALAAVFAAFAFFVTFSQLLSMTSTNPPVSLLSEARWGFLWIAGIAAFVGKGLDLIRVRLHDERIRKTR